MSDLKIKSRDHFYGFWQYALGVDGDQIKDGDNHFSFSGLYLERDSKVIYIFHNCLDNTKIICTNEMSSKIINEKLDGFNVKSILSINYFQNYKLEFDDLDFYLEEEIKFRPILQGNLELRPIKNEDSFVTSFLRGFSEDDIDTLDLDFEDENNENWAILKEGNIIGMGRYYVIPQTNGIMDITLLTNLESRGLGVATYLLYVMLTDGLSKGLCPRYRVKTDNHASIAVAKKFGFKQYNHIQTLLMKDPATIS